MRRDHQHQGKRILFWAERSYVSLPAMNALLGALGVTPRGEPQAFVRRDIPWADREELGKALALRTQSNPIGGDILMSYMGWADCRICGEKLGTADLFGYGFVWPEKAEHYILRHNVWTPDCDDLLAAVRRTNARPR